jgi:riboflavin kinase/FMN adenylyltransferase
MSLLGTVVHGDGRGAQIGYPTANLEVRSEAFPPFGVYAVTARTGQGDLPAVMNYGLRPTFHQDDTHGVFEIHVLDRHDLELYGQRVEVFLHERLRREQRFGNVEDLKAQIGKDVERARSVVRRLPEG